MKLSFIINKKINKIIEAASKKLGTSKRNIIAIALTEILNQPIDAAAIEEMKENITLDYPTSITINSRMNKRINEINKFGLSKRLFVGYLVSDYFYKNYTKFITNEELKAIQISPPDNSKSVIQVYTDKKIKTKLLDYCNEHSVSLSALVSHYLMNEEIEFFPYQVDEKVLINLSLGNDVKSIIEKNAEKIGTTVLFYLNIVLFQIYNDLRKDGLIKTV